MPKNTGQLVTPVIKSVLRRLAKQLSKDDCDEKGDLKEAILKTLQKLDFGDEMKDAATEVQTNVSSYVKIVRKRLRELKKRKTQTSPQTQSQNSESITGLAASLCESEHSDVTLTSAKKRRRHNEHVHGVLIDKAASQNTESSTISTFREILRNFSGNHTNLHTGRKQLLLDVQKIGKLFEKSTVMLHATFENDKTQQQSTDREASSNDILQQNSFESVKFEESIQELQYVNSILQIIFIRYESVLNVEQTLSENAMNFTDVCQGDNHGDEDFAMVSSLTHKQIHKLIYQQCLNLLFKYYKCLLVLQTTPGAPMKSIRELLDEYYNLAALILLQRCRDEGVQVIDLTPLFLFLEMCHEELSAAQYQQIDIARLLPASIAAAAATTTSGILQHRNASDMKAAVNVGIARHISLLLPVKGAPVALSSHIRVRNTFKYFLRSVVKHRASQKILQWVKSNAKSTTFFSSQLQEALYHTTVEDLFSILMDDQITTFAEVSVIIKWIVGLNNDESKQKELNGKNKAGQSTAQHSSEYTMSDDVLFVVD